MKKVDGTAMRKLLMSRANTVYKGEYLLGASIARPLIAKRLVEIVSETDADAISHGATGKGYDQVRFELGAYALKTGYQYHLALARVGPQLARNPDGLSRAEQYLIRCEATDKTFFHEGRSHYVPIYSRSPFYLIAFLPQLSDGRYLCSRRRRIR